MEISRDAALALLKNKEAVDNHISVSERMFDFDQRSAKFRLWAEERNNIIGMRQSWSSWILRCILLIVGVDILMMFLLGFHLISFDAQWFVPAFIVDSTAKILGLAAIIVGFLFGKDSIHSKDN